MKIFKRHNPSWGKFITINLWVVYIYWSESDKSGWLRMFGTGGGIHWKHKSSPLMFSERYGYTKLYTIGNYNFKFIK